MIKKRNSQHGVMGMVEESLDDLSQIKDVAQSIRKFNKLKYPSPREYTAEDVQNIRKKLHVSQSVFAYLLNTQITTVQKWERGVNTPSGPASRLIQILEKKGPKTFQFA